MPNDPVKYEPEQTVDNDFADYVCDTDANQSSAIAASLEKFFGIALKGSTADAVHLAGKRIRFKRMQRISKFWEKKLQDEAIIGEVPPWISLLSKSCPCLVVGIMIADDVDELSYAHGTSREVGGHLKAPVVTAALGTAGVPSQSGAGDPQVSAESSEESTTAFKARSERSNICALELRAITTALFKRKQLQLKADGPTFLGRMADDGDSEDEEAGDEDLILDDLTESQWRSLVQP